MKGVLLRAGSVPVHSSSLPGSPRVSISSSDKTEFPASPRISLNLKVNNNFQRISRTISEQEVMIRSRLNSARSLSFPTKIPEAEEDVVEDIGSLTFAEKCLDRMSWPPVTGIMVEELGFPDTGSGSGCYVDGFGKGGSSGGSNNDNNADQSKIGAYYLQMLKSNPTDSLLLRNYAKFLHEVEGDAVKAEEYYGRAILASPGDGEVLSLYGKLIWETHRDSERAKSYFDQAVSASPNDCMVMGSYAQFMWESEEEEEDDEEEEEVEYGTKVSVLTPMVGAC